MNNAFGFAVRNGMLVAKWDPEAKAADLRDWLRDLEVQLKWPQMRRGQTEWWCPVVTKWYVKEWSKEEDRYVYVGTGFDSMVAAREYALDTGLHMDDLGAEPRVGSWHLSEEM